MPETTRLALIGLDGATFRVLDPLREQGVMPALSKLRERGAEGVLRSTIPSYTPPAWVSIATGVNPGRHGVFGFLATTPQERPRIAHSGSIGATTLWRHLSDRGVKVGVFNVPMSYPPVAVSGFMVSGGLAAGWTDAEMPNFASDPEVGRMVNGIAGGHYPLDVEVNYERDWRSAAAIQRIHDVQVLRRKALAACIERVDPEVVFAVFEGPDRIQHVHYQYVVEGSDWYERAEAPAIRERALGYFAELDRAIADLTDWAGDDGHVVIVSDHGAGPWEKTVNVNLLLHEWGYLELPSLGRLARLGPIAGRGQQVLRRVLPKSLLLKAKVGMTRNFVWERTKAFSSHVAEQGIHVNERGRLPHGVLDPDEARRVGDEISERLMAFRDPHDGGPVTDRVYRRDEIMHGRFVDRAPDLFPLLRDQRYELSDTVAASSPVTDHRDRPWGYHHVDGVLVAAGPSVKRGRFDAHTSVVDVLPTSFHLSGHAVPPDLDGRVVEEIVAGERPVTYAGSADGPAEGTDYPFSAEEEAAIEESLRGLGYIE